WDRLTLPRPMAFCNSARSASSSPSTQSGTRSRRSSPLPLTERMSQVQAKPAPAPRRAAKPVIETVIASPSPPRAAFTICRDFRPNPPHRRYVHPSVTNLAAALTQACRRGHRPGGIRHRHMDRTAMVCSFPGGRGQAASSPRGPAELRAYWEGLRRGGSIPCRADLDPRGMAGVLDRVFVGERIGTGLVRLRIAGTALTDIAGLEMKGLPLSALFLPEARARLADV